METNHLTGVGMLLVLLLAVSECGEVQFLERRKGDSVVLPCVYNGSTEPKPIALALKRRWLQAGQQVLYMHTGTRPAGRFSSRTSVSGDPSTGRANITVTHLEGSDTDRYYCEFVLNPAGGNHVKIPSETEFFLYVNDIDIPGSLDVVLLETCEGGSVVVPCLPPPGEAARPTGEVSLKRWRGRGQAEVLFHSQRRTASSPFGPERLHLGTAPSGLAYNLTLLRLQHEDSAFYSCELLHPDRPDYTSLGRHMYFVSVKDGQCQCSTYATLLYATSGAVGLLLIMVIALACRSKARDRVKPQPQAPIYEEMVGVRSPSRKVASYHLEETDTSLYCTAPDKVRNENPYDVPGAQIPH